MCGQSFQRYFAWCWVFSPNKYLDGWYSHDLLWSGATFFTRTATVFIFISYCVWVFIYCTGSSGIPLPIHHVIVAFPDGIDPYIHLPLSLDFTPIHHLATLVLISTFSSNSLFCTLVFGIYFATGHSCFWMDFSPWHWFPVSTLTVNKTQQAPHPTVLIYSVVFLKHINRELSKMFWLMLRTPHGKLTGDDLDTYLRY